MAKKTAAGRMASRRPTTAARSASVTLVGDSEAKSANGTGASLVAAAPPVNAKRAAAAALTARPIATAPAKPVAAPARTGTPARTAMPARPRATVANTMTNKRTLIRAENYSYVRRDLILILSLAVVMFAAMIVLHFVFPS